MCGIFGSPNFTPEVRRMLPHLAYAMQERGTHSWGASDGHSIIKYLNAICFTWHEAQEEIQTWDRGIFHTRAASHGAHDKVENAHPFTGEREDGSLLVGIHNGQLRNHQWINTRYNRKCEVDSMHLWLHRAAGYSWRDFTGFAALAWWDVPPAPGDGSEPAPEMFLARINSPHMHVGVTQDGGLVFCSTEEALRKSAAFAGTSLRTYYNFKPNLVYRAGDDGVLYDTQESVSFMTEEATCGNGMPASRPLGVVASSRTGVRNPVDGECWKCTHAIPKDHILCHECLQAFVDGYLDNATSKESENDMPDIVRAAALAALGGE